LLAHALLSSISVYQPSAAGGWLKEWCLILEGSSNVKGKRRLKRFPSLTPPGSLYKEQFRFGVHSNPAMR
jgi:hypothetical protein